MLFSWVLSKFSLSKEIIFEIFFESMFPLSFCNDNRKKFKFIKEFNQRALGRKLRANENIETTIDSFFAKIYKEFGANAFTPEVFASIITSYLNMLSKMKEVPKTIEKIDLVFDNDESVEDFEIVRYLDFKTATKGLFVTGCFAGADREIWENCSPDKQTNIILACLKNSPLLIETVGHAILLTGYLPEDELFIINDSLYNTPRVIKKDALLKALTTIVMFFRIPSN
jgi:hypothetical protein